MKTNMEKEIFEQGNVLEKIKNSLILDGSINFKKIPTNFTSIKFIASGSSYNAIRLGHKFFELYSDKIITFEYASEFISNTTKTINKETLYVFVSQSGETYDTKCALDIVKKEGGKTLAVVNNSNSTIYNSSDYKIDVMAGVENSIAATKSFLACVVVLWLLALYFANKPAPIGELNEAITAISETLENSFLIDSIAAKLSKKKKISIIGYNFGYIIAKEASLKIKETSYIDTTAYPTGEFLHGHTAVLNKSKTLIEIFTSDLSDFEKNTLDKIKKDFNPQIFSITDKKIKSKNAIIFNSYKYEISKICAITAIIQLLALKIATSLNLDVDKPTGLNKVVK